MIDLALIGPVSPYKGGIAHFNTRLLRALDGRANVLPIGWQPLSLRRLRGPWLEPGLDAKGEGNPPVRLDFVDPRTWSSAAALLREARPSRVVLHWVNLICAPAYLALMRASRGLGSSNELIVHNAISHESHLLGRVATRVVLRSADRAITHSQWDAQMLRRWRPGLRVDAVFHPIYDSLRSHGVSGSPPGLLEDVEGPVLLFVGFIRPYK